MIGNRGIFVFSFGLQLSLIAFTVARQGQGSRTLCGGTYSGREGKIKSPRYPNFYYPRSNCLYKITVPSGLRVKLKFQNFSIEPAGKRPAGICYDFVEIHDGPSTQNRSLGKFCGNLKPSSIYSTSNVMLVRFHSDQSLQKEGFQLVYQAKPLSRNQKQTLPPTSVKATTVSTTAAPVVTTTQPSCPPGQFQCKNGKCIKMNWRCDSLDDCGDMSDEQKCPCRSNQMTCANGKCVDKIWMCDGSDDCGDGSDEKNCSAPTPPSSSMNCSVNNGGCEHKCTEFYVGKRKNMACTCRRGYKLLPDGKKCADIDECKVNNGGCHQVCLNIRGGRVCACNKGYFLTRNKVKCADINECASNNGGCNHDCINTAGSFHCRCYPGFEFESSDNKKCRDINECDINNGGCSHNCFNFAGSYYCQCPTGYRLLDDTKTCVDIDECAVNNGGCQHECQNTLGSFICRCKDGYFEDIMNPSKCIDINECAEGIPACFDCVNTPGSYECKCDDPGFIQNKNKTQCIDIDECASQNGGCGEHKCINSYGSYSCQCNPGYQLDPKTKRCVDIDECATSDYKGDCDQICKNTPGSYKCACRDGYKLRQRTKCLDIDECAEGAHQCAHNCTNTDGSYTCSCKKGFFLSIDGHSCGKKKDLPECGIAPLAGKSFPGRWHSQQQPTWPWTALLYFSVFGDIEGCMATLIDKEWLITSAHCLYLGQRAIPAKHIKVELGAFKRGTSHHKLVLHDVSQIVIHKDFNQNLTLDRKVLSANIALLRLAKPVDVTDKIRPICMPTRMEVDHLLRPGVQRDGVVVGWGKTSDHRVRSTLHEAAVYVEHRSSCRWTKISYDPLNMICAGYKEDQKTHCIGDSGSPLMFSIPSVDQSTPKWVLGGVMSWGLSLLPEGCHRDYRYTVYTSVGRYLKWIKFRGNRWNTK